MYLQVSSTAQGAQTQGARQNAGPRFTVPSDVTDDN